MDNGAIGSLVEAKEGPRRLEDGAVPAAPGRSSEQERSADRSARWSTWAPGAALVFVLGLVQIGRQDLWLDEGFSVAATRDLGRTLSETHGTMSLYYAILTPWSRISTAPEWLRLPSLVAMAGAVAILALVVARISGASAGRAAGLVAAVSYLPVRYGVEARSFALETLLVALGWYSLDRAIEDEEDRRWWVVFTACSLALPLVHGLSVVQLAAQGAALLYARPGRRAVRRLLGALAGGFAVVILLLAVGISEVGNWVEPLSIDQLQDFSESMLNPNLPVTAVLVLFAGFGAAVLLRRPAGTPLDRLRRVSLVLWGPGAIAILIALSAVRPSLLSRYALPSALGLAALVAVTCTRLDRTSRAPLAAACLILVASTGQFALEPAGRTWQAAVDQVRERARPGDGVLFATPDVRIPFEATWLRTTDRPDLDIVGPGTDLGSFDRFGGVAPARSLVSDLRGRMRVWVIEQPHAHQPSRLAAVTRSTELRTEFRLAERWTLDQGIDVRLYVRNG